MDQTNPSQPQSPASGTPDRAALDAELMREIEDALGDMSLEDMMNDRSGAMRGAAPVKGERQLRTGTIFRVHDGEVYVEFDPKRQGVCPVAQFEQEPKPGEKYDFFEERIDVRLEGRVGIGQRCLGKSSSRYRQSGMGKKV